MRGSSTPSTARRRASDGERVGAFLVRALPLGGELLVGVLEAVELAAERFVAGGVDDRVSGGELLEELVALQSSSPITRKMTAAMSTFAASCLLHMVGLAFVGDAPRPESNRVKHPYVARPAGQTGHAPPTGAAFT
jgi:hypothetical protein